MTDAPVTPQALTPADLAQMRARAQPATHGPWEIDPQGTPDEHEQPLIVADGGLANIALMEFPNEPTEDQAAADAYMLANAEFITACRDWVLRALAHIDRLTAQVAYWQTCVNCGQQMDEPGNCSNAIREEHAALNGMFEDAIKQRDQAESALKAQVERRCVWTEDEWGSYFWWCDTSCGRRGHYERGAKFCLYCGGALEVQAR